MEKARISASQLFVLIVLFQLSNSFLLSLGINGKQDAWLIILIAMAISMVLFFVYYALYQYHPGILPTEYIEELIGKLLGRTLAFLYILYFITIASRVLRDIGETLVTFAYPETPLFVMNALMIFVVVYTVYKGIENIARTGELLVVIMFLLILSIFLLVVLTGLIDTSNLQPVLENPSTVMKTVFTETLYVPFGEIIIFTMIFSYLTQPKKVIKAGVLAISVTGVILAITMALNISVLGVMLTSRSYFPMLTTIQSIEVGEFLERLDVFFILVLVIGGFFKVTVYTYGAVIGTASLFKFKEPSKLAYPLGIVILILSMIIASSYAEHIQEGLKVFPLYVHIPFQVIIPVSLLLIAFVKNRKK
ncbi:GerAB/ArcD/ProY family transporter [Oceanobacillus sp. CFH 90083]|uniref:GerAB/ArcD/ProY family transporter n=1 Tax=Oceanobacillus sp. CFH 90083 TaxID=2592336 RepID=UPI00128E3B4C|nr:GerAB/ArcD/ProY family transporter [Oceanobacillus sp. CFH 90083]